MRAVTSSNVRQRHSMRRAPRSQPRPPPPRRTTSGTTTGRALQTAGARARVYGTRPDGNLRGREPRQRELYPVGGARGRHFSRRYSLLWPSNRPSVSRSGQGRIFCAAVGALRTCRRRYRCCRLPSDPSSCCRTLRTPRRRRHRNVLRNALRSALCLSKLRRKGGADVVIIPRHLRERRGQGRFRFRYPSHPAARKGRRRRVRLRRKRRLPPVQQNQHHGHVVAPRVPGPSRVGGEAGVQECLADVSRCRPFTEA